MILDSGYPILLQAIIVLTARFKAFGFAFPISSLANITNLLVIKSTLSPPFINLLI